MARNFPASQFVHTDDAASAHVPARQVLHVASEVAVVAALNFPAAHCAQEVMLPLDHAPVPHGVHCNAPKTTPVAEPAGHTSHVDAPLAAAKRFAVQSEHADSAVAPILALALPVAHAEHVAEDTAPEAVL